MYTCKTIFIYLFFCNFLILVRNEEYYLQNLDDHCFHCLCQAASNCDLNFGCQDGYCGPFRISKIYWVDAGKQVQPDDDPDRPGGAFEDCTFHYECAVRIMKGYFAKYGRDCNGDGITNCDDYGLIHANGGFICDLNLTRKESGRKWLERYQKCNPSFIHLQ